MQITEQLRERTWRNYTTNFKNYNKAKVIKTVRYWSRIDIQVNRREKKIQKQIKTHTKMYYVTNVAFLHQLRKGKLDKSWKKNQLIIQKIQTLTSYFIFK